MTKDEALKLALDAFGEIAWSNETQWQRDRAKEAITAIKEALAQPEEEPLHPVHIGVDVTKEGTAVTAFYRKPDAVMEMFYSQFHPLAQPEQEPVAWKTDDVELYVREDKFGFYNIPLYTHPPQRKPLTDEEVNKLVDDEDWYNDPHGFVRAIEAALRSKNT